MSSVSVPTLRAMAQEEAVAKYGGVLTRGTRFVFFDGDVEVGTGTLIAEVVEFILVPKPHQRKGYGQAILTALVERGGRTALAISPAGERLLRRAGWHNRYRPKGQWDVVKYRDVKYVERPPGRGVA